MNKILLAFSSRTIGEALEEKLSGAYEVTLCLDGDEVARELAIVKPDVLVLDVMIAGIDSLSILRSAKDAGVCKKAVVAAGYITDYLLASLEGLNVCYVIHMPCDVTHLAGRIADVAQWVPEEEKLPRKIRNILIALGCKINTEAYRITERAIQILAQDPTLGMTTGLYPLLAKEFDCTPAKVERAIRTCVESAWLNGNERIWRLYFSAGRNGTVRKPSNGEFLTRIAHCLDDSTNEIIKGERKTS